MKQFRYGFIILLITIGLTSCDQRRVLFKEHISFGEEMIWNQTDAKVFKIDVQENKHLPGVVAAKEVAENGLNLGETQKAQMEKIEELFLHVISLEKRINALEKQNEALQTENSALKSANTKH